MRENNALFVESGNEFTLVDTGITTTAITTTTTYYYYCYFIVI